MAGTNSISFDRRNSMSIRTAQRRIAKARMAALGIDRINRKMGGKIRYSNGSIRRMMRTARGRQHYAELVEDDTPNWRRILTGDIAEAAERAQIGKQKRRIDSSGRIFRKLVKIHADG